MTLRRLPVALLASAAFALPALAQEPAPATPPADATAPAAPAEAPATPAPASAAPAPAAPATSLVGPPPEGKGQVVFFRPSNFVGMAVSFSVREGGKGVAKLGNGSYAVIPVEPGPHAYTIEFEAADTLNLEVDAGETYYVRQTIGVGVVAARPHLTPSDEGEFSKLKLKLTTQKPTDKKAADKADKAD